MVNAKIQTIYIIKNIRIVFNLMEIIVNYVNLAMHYMAQQKGVSKWNIFLTELLEMIVTSITAIYANLMHHLIYIQ